jgi:ABC-type Fe3+ transport system permease subunit
MKMDFKTIREFHWITKMVIVLTALLLGLLIAAAVVGSYWMSNQNDQNAFNANQGLLGMVMSLAWILIQVFFLILIIIVIYMAVMRVKAWIEKYLDAMLGKLDMLTEQKAEREEAGTVLAVMNGKVERIEKKLDNIERILEKVAE